MPGPVERAPELAHVAAEARQSGVDGLGELAGRLHFEVERLLKASLVRSLLVFCD